MSIIFSPRRPKPPLGRHVLLLGESSDCEESLLDRGYAVTRQGDLRHTLQALLDADFVVVTGNYLWDSDANLVAGVARQLKLPVVDCTDLMPVTVD